MYCQELSHYCLGHYCFSGSGIITDIWGALQNSFIQSNLKSNTILELQKIPCC